MPCPWTSVACVLNPFINSREKKKFFKVKHRILALGDFPGGLEVKTLLLTQEAHVRSLVREQRSTYCMAQQKKKPKNPGPGMIHGDLVPQGLCLPCRKSADILQF